MFLLSFVRLSFSARLPKSIFDTHNRSDHGFFYVVLSFVASSPLLSWLRDSLFACRFVVGWFGLFSPRPSHAVHDRGFRRWNDASLLCYFIGLSIFFVFWFMCDVLVSCFLGSRLSPSACLAQIRHNGEPRSRCQRDDSDVSRRRGKTNRIYFSYASVFFPCVSLVSLTPCDPPLSGPSLSPNSRSRPRSARPPRELSPPAASPKPSLSPVSALPSTLRMAFSSSSRSESYLGSRFSSVRPRRFQFFKKKFLSFISSF